MGVAFGLGLMVSPAAEAASPPPVIGCASLANLRILLRQTKADAVAAAAVLADDRADHLGCVVLARDAVMALREHLTLNGDAYDCLTLRSTSVCHWAVAGTATPTQQPAKARAGEKARPSEKSPQGTDKARR